MAMTMATMPMAMAMTMATISMTMAMAMTMAIGMAMIMVMTTAMTILARLEQHASGVNIQEKRLTSHRPPLTLLGFGVFAKSWFLPRRGSMEKTFRSLIRLR